MFQPSNVRDESKINQCREIRGKNGGRKLIESNSGLEREIISDCGDLLMRVFWDRNTYYIVDVRISDVNQASFLIRKPASIIKSGEGPCLEQRRHFILFIIACEGLFGKQVDVFFENAI